MCDIRRVQPPNSPSTQFHTQDRAVNLLISSKCIITFRNRVNRRELTIVDVPRKLFIILQIKDMSSRIHRASELSRIPGSTEYGQLSPVAKPGKACSILDMNLRSPLVSKQAPPSPPTSTPTQPPPHKYPEPWLRTAASFSSRSHADQQKRARLSLAAPQLTLPISPSTSRNRSTNLRLLQSNGSPLAVPRRPKSPTLSTSAGSKQAGRRNPHRMLTDEDGALLVYSSDESSDSDYEVAFTLLSDTHGTRRTSSCSRLQRLQEKFNDDPVEELTELRPILKKTRAQILLAETVQQATAENGRPRLSLDPLPLLAYRRVIATTSSKTPGQTNSTLPGDTSGIALAGDVTALHHSAEHLGFHGVDSSSLPGNPDSAISDAIEESLLSSARSCIITLQASLLPPPDEMRLDPVSPLAKLTSPQKLKLSKLGTLDEHDPDSWTLVAQGRSKPSDSSSTPTTSSVTSGPLRTPESSPVRQSQSLPRGAITLREVEDAYISLHDHLDALVRHWKGLGPPCDADQQLRLRSLFADDAGACLMKCLYGKLKIFVDTMTPPRSTASYVCQQSAHFKFERRDFSHDAPQSRVICQTNIIERSSAPIPGIVNKSGASTNEIRRRVAEIETGQAALRCVAILWSWPSVWSTLTRLLSLLLQIPKSSVLRRKKNLGRCDCKYPVSVCWKKAETKAKRSCAGLSALEQLTTQMPQHVVPNIGKFWSLSGILNGSRLSNVKASSRRRPGCINQLHQSGMDMSYKTHARVQLHESRISAEALLKLQQGRKDAFKEKLSTFALAYYNDQNTFIRWLLLAKQFKRSLNEGDVAWVISVMATMIVLIGNGAYFVPGNTLSAPTAPSPNAHNSSTANSDKYKSLLQPGKDSVVTSPQINQSVPNTSHQSASSSGNSQRQSLDGPQSSSHHIVLSAFLYGAVGFIKDNLAHPPVCLRSPSELLAMTRTCSRSTT
ncbi:hypothetical protein H4Q26_009848 [Puccinia striiformis f. sp. tritici PST-130]|nr:hypothetical protein H4Q26_009848 [Puccinia striiformis f. sp. tritici PST-130]